MKKKPIDINGCYAVIVDEFIYSIHRKRDEASAYAYRQFSGMEDKYEIREINISLAYAAIRNESKK